MVEKKALFLDRDGVINSAKVEEGKPYPPRSMDEFKILPHVKDALILSRDKGYINIIVTNQPDLSTGMTTLDLVNQFHDNLYKELAVDCIYMCPHVDQDKCNCRKPLSGMLHQAAKDFGVRLDESVIVGDRWRDIQCGHNAGLKEKFFIDYGYQDKLPTLPFKRVENLLEVIEQL